MFADDQMSRGSIRLRLWCAATISILIGFVIAGVGASYLVERHLEWQVVWGLTSDLDRLITSTSSAGDLLRAQLVPADPRYETPLSGYYWQVEDTQSGRVARSHSLNDSALALPATIIEEDIRYVDEIIGPDGEPLLALQRTINQGGSAVHFVVTATQRTVDQLASAYLDELVLVILLLALVLVAAIFVQITIGLAPVEELRISVGDVIAQRGGRLKASAPSELQPLVAEINRLLEIQERALGRARTRAVDLAHGLKTPLQILSADIRMLRHQGQAELADQMAKSVMAIQWHVERELARAHVGDGVSAPLGCSLVDAADSIISVVKRTAGGEHLAFVVKAAPDLIVPIDEGDLFEILGNVIENAARFAKSRVSVEAERTAQGTVIRITDNGPGIVGADKKSVLLRGVRHDRMEPETASASLLSPTSSPPMAVD